MPRAATKSTASKQKDADGKKRRRKPNTSGFSTYSNKVLKQVHPDIGISKKAMTVIDGMTKNSFDMIMNEAARLASHTGKQTITAREIQFAVKLLLPGELAKHAVSEGLKAVTKYNAAK